MRSVLRLLSLTLLGSFLSLGVLIAAPVDDVAETEADQTTVEAPADPAALDEVLPGLAIPEVTEMTDCCFAECEQGYFDCMWECKAAGGTSMSCSPGCSAEHDDCLAGC